MGLKDLPSGLHVWDALHAIVRVRFHGTAVSTRQDKLVETQTGTLKIKHTVSMSALCLYISCGKKSRELMNSGKCS